MKINFNWAIIFYSHLPLYDGKTGLGAVLGGGGACLVVTCKIFIL